MTVQLQIFVTIGKITKFDALTQHSTCKEDVDENIHVTEEFCAMISMNATLDIVFVRLLGTLDEIIIQWTQIVSLVPEDTWLMIR